MSSLLKKIHPFSSINQKIQSHDAWKDLNGLDAEKLLEAKGSTGHYILRKGEHQNSSKTNYYLTFLHEDGKVRHQPFVIIDHLDGSWSYLNGGGGGPFIEASIDDVIHSIMHVEKNKAKPFIS